MKHQKGRLRKDLLPVYICLAGGCRKGRIRLFSEVQSDIATSWNMGASDQMQNFFIQKGSQILE